MDILYVNRIPFLLCKSSGINYLHVTKLKSRGKKELRRKLKFIKPKYTKRGYIISSVHGDNEYYHEDIKEVFSDSDINICAKDEHVPGIERAVRTVKDRVRSLCHSVPYKRFTKLMTIHVVLTEVKWINVFPFKTGVSNTLSPETLLDGKEQPDLSIKRIPFGSYALIYTVTNNNMSKRSTPAIALSESNGAGGFYFMSLYSGKRLHSNKWTELPPDEGIIQKVMD